MWSTCTNAEKEEWFSVKTNKSRSGSSGSVVPTVNTKAASSNTATAIKKQKSMSSSVDGVSKSPRKVVEAEESERLKPQKMPPNETNGGATSAEHHMDGKAKKSKKAIKRIEKPKAVDDAAASASSVAIEKSKPNLLPEKKSPSKKSLVDSETATLSRDQEATNYKPADLPANLPAPKPNIMNVSTPVAASKTSSRKRKNTESEQALAVEAAGKMRVLSSPIVRTKKAKAIAPANSSPAGSVFGSDNSVIIAAGSSPHQMSPSIGNRSRESSVVSVMGSRMTAKIIIPKLKARKS
jgi:hypothetical protein